MVYSRENPSPQYDLLLKYYKQMHQDGYAQIRGETTVKKEGKDSFPGKKTLYFASKIRTLLLRNEAKTCLDYGAGKAVLYSKNATIEDAASGKKYAGLQQFWGLDEAHTWEPGLDDGGPKGTFDAVICIDVLEHCYAADLPWIVEELFSLARSCVFLNIACYPAQAMLPNGENVHISVRSSEWWTGFIAVISAKFPHIDYLVCCAVGNALGEKETVWLKRPEFPASIEGEPVLTTA